MYIFMKKKIVFLLQKLEKKHVKLIFDWANDSEVRKNSLNSEPILWDNHLEWFSSKLSNPDSRIFIFENGNIPVGQVRIDKNSEDSWLIDYSVDNNQRGKGYGFLMINALIRRYENLKFLAIVKNENIASKRVFEKLGFAKEICNKEGLIRYLIL